MLAVLAPSIVIAYVVFAAFVALVAVFAKPGVSSALLQGPDIAAQIVFTPLLAAWASWVGIAISTRSSDVRVAQQLSLLGNLPLVLLTSLVAFNAIEPTRALAIGFGVVLLVGDVVAWRRIVTPLVDRERLVTGGLSGAAPAGTPVRGGRDHRPRRCRLAPHSTLREAIARPCSSDSPSSPRTRSSARSR